jgi:sterol 24-C-methyltransferase
VFHRVRYENYHEIYGGEVESRTSNYADLANKYYDLVTSFYEYGWGESFHFGSRWQGETLRESLKRHEHFLALQLGLKKGMKVNVILLLITVQEKRIIY